MEKLRKIRKEEFFGVVAFVAAAPLVVLSIYSALFFPEEAWLLFIGIALVSFASAAALLYYFYQWRTLMLSRVEKKFNLVLVEREKVWSAREQQIKQQAVVVRKQEANQVEILSQKEENQLLKDNLTQQKEYYETSLQRERREVEQSQKKVRSLECELEQKLQAFESLRAQRDALQRQNTEFKSQICAAQDKYETSYTDLEQQLEAKIKQCEERDREAWDANQRASDLAVTVKDLRYEVKALLEMVLQQ